MYPWPVAYTQDQWEFAAPERMPDSSLRWSGRHHGSFNRRDARAY
jgi:hypothetical protein